MADTPRLRLQIQALQRELEDERARHNLAEATIAEKCNIMTELLLLIGGKETCSKCGAPAFWIRPRGKSSGLLLNLDGSQHWARCPQTARPTMGDTAS